MKFIVVSSVGIKMVVCIPNYNKIPKQIGKAFVLGIKLYSFFLQICYTVFPNVSSMISMLNVSSDHGTTGGEYVLE